MSLYNGTRGPLHQFIHRWGPLAWLAIEAYGGRTLGGWLVGPPKGGHFLGPANQEEGTWEVGQLAPHWGGSGGAFWVGGEGPREVGWLAVRGGTRRGWPGVKGYGRLASWTPIEANRGAGWAGEGGGRGHMKLTVGVH